MDKRQLIEKICSNKTIRIFSARTDQNTVSFVESYRNCGNSSCTRCRLKESRPHGPYWNLNYYDEKGKLRTMYVGKALPQIAFYHKRIFFADVLAFYRQREEQQQVAARFETRISRLKQENEKLYEELRSAHHQLRKNGSGKADKLFRQLAAKYHPDRQTGKSFPSEEVMRDINQLYQLLK
jgi:hypothetical protein